MSFNFYEGRIYNNTSAANLLMWKNFYLVSVFTFKILTMTLQEITLIIIFMEGNNTILPSDSY